MILGIRAVLELSETSGGIDKNDGFLLPNGKPSVHVDRCRNCIAFVSGRAMLRVMKCWILALTGAALLAGCAPGPLNPQKMGSSGPLNMPAKGSDVEAGAGSLEAVRRQLEGSWTLEWYDIYENGKRRRLPAGGDLVYDAYGNLTLHGELKQPQAGTEARPLVLNYSGRAVLDVRTRELRLQDVAATGDALPRPVEDQVNTANVRHYDLNGSTLTLTVVGDDGKPTAVSSWKKRS
jgi:hypothetical protein